MSENDSNKNKNRLPNKKTKLIMVMSLILVILACVGTYYVKYSAERNTLAQIDSEESKCEILDKSVLNTDELKSWNDENKGTKQEITTTDDTYTYALISYGNTKEPDVGICLENVEYTDSITISYSIIKGKSTEEVDEYTPEMLLRFKGTNLKLNFKDTTEQNPVQDEQTSQEDK